MALAILDRLANGLMASPWKIDARLLMTKVAEHDDSSSEQGRRRLTISLPFDVFSMLAAEEYQRKLQGKDASASTIISEAVRAFLSKASSRKGSK